MDLAGQYYRTEIDDQYDAFLSLLGQGWLVRKAAAGTVCHDSERAECASYGDAAGVCVCVCVPVLQWRSTRASPAC